MSQPPLLRIGRLLLLLLLLLFTAASIVLFVQSKPQTAYAAQCYPGECAPNKYVCQNGTMCCTGGGCPSWVCAKSGCTYRGGGVCEKSYTYNCSPWRTYCTFHGSVTHRHAPTWTTHTDPSPFCRFFCGLNCVCSPGRC